MQGTETLNTILQCKHRAYILFCGGGGGGGEKTGFIIGYATYHKTDYFYLSLIY